jgi:hypothetical protein
LTAAVAGRPTGDKLIATYDAVVARAVSASRSLLAELAALTAD